MNAPDKITERFVTLALNTIAPSATAIQGARRKRFNKEALQQLADSIKATDGPIQPIIVRPHPQPTDLLKWELVAGERRWKASGIAAFVSINAIVRDLDDQQVLELQLIENLQREDLHPMEEAEGYRDLMKLRGLTADQVAERIGKSQRYVFNRLKLLELCPEGREAFYAGDINASVAFLVARIGHHDTQRQALKALAQRGGEVTARGALDLIAREYMLELKSAPFDVKATYFKPYGAKPIGMPCGECPKRTGNQKELFADVKNADVCTDPKCFGDKREAHKAAQAAQAKEEGRKVITGKDAIRILPYHSPDSIGDDTHYTAATGYAPGFDKPWSKVLGKNMPAPVLVEHERSGTLVEVYEVAALKEAARAAGLKVKANAPKSESRARELETENKARMETATRLRILAAIRAASVNRALGLEDTRLVAHALFDLLSHDDTKLLVDHYMAVAGQPKPKGQEYVSQWRDNLAKLDARRLGVLMIDMALIGECKVNSYSLTHKAEDLEATAARLKVDVAGIRKQVKGEFEARGAAKKAKK